jgi:hypothetical protein
MGAYADMDTSKLEAFTARLHSAANGDFQREAQGFLEGLGYEFLRVLQDEIIRRKVMDTRLLLTSFQTGNENGIWSFNDDGLTLEVGTNVSYASYANDGHYTTKAGQAKRFVPGVWEGDRFIYTPGAKTGMVLKLKWIEGKHYWESALRLMERMIPEMLETKVQAWLNSYFAEFI